MYQFNLVIGGCVLLMTWITVQGDGCINRETYGLPEINMCEQRSWTLGRVVISMTSDNMGSNTGCVCVIRSRMPGVESTTTLFLKGTESNVTRCTKSQIQIDPFSDFPTPRIQNFTCTSPLESTSYSGRTIDDVTITLTRPDTSVGVSYCVIVVPDRYQENDVVLSCQSGLTPPPALTTSSSTAFPSSTSPSTTTATTRLTTTVPTSTTPTTTESTTAPSSSSTLPTSLSLSTMTPTASSPSTSAPDGDSVFTGSFSTTQTGFQASEGQDFPIGAVAGIVLGAIALICLTVIVLFYIRHRRKPASSPETGADNSAYTSLSDVTRVTPRADPNYAVIQSERSSTQPDGNDATSPASVYETVDADGSVTRDSNYVNSSNVGKGTYYNV